MCSAVVQCAKRLLPSGCKSSASAPRSSASAPSQSCNFGDNDNCSKASEFYPPPPLSVTLWCMVHGGCKIKILKRKFAQVLVSVLSIVRNLNIIHQAATDSAATISICLFMHRGLTLHWLHWLQGKVPTTEFASYFLQTASSLHCIGILPAGAFRSSRQSIFPSVFALREPKNASVHFPGIHQVGHPLQILVYRKLQNITMQFSVIESQTFYKCKHQWHWSFSKALLTESIMFQRALWSSHWLICR